MMVVEQMLKTHGRNRLLRRGDWPRYVERIPQAYSPEELKRFFAACKPHDFLLFQFFLGSGFREKEVQFLTWRDISLEEQLARVTAKSECGFFPRRNRRLHRTWCCPPQNKPTGQEQRIAQR